MKFNEFEYKLLKFIKEERLITSGEKILLGVSGGADSIAMMYALNSINSELKAEFVVVHLNHMLRPEAIKEGPAVCKIARDLNMKCWFESRDVLKYKEKNKGLSLEEAARIVRYDFFEDAFEKFKADKIATAHHLSDLTENFFIRLFRGSGVGGLVGMSPISGKYIKPFLPFDEKTIREYVTIKRLSFFEDKTNDDMRYVRNKVRHLLIPTIKNEFCHNIEGNISKVTQILREYQRFVHNSVQKIFERSFFDENGNLSFCLKDLVGEDNLLLSEVVKEIFRRFNIEISSVKIKSVIKLIEKKGEGELNLGKGVYALKSRKNLSIGSKPQPLRWGAMKLDVPSKVKVEKLQMEISAFVKDYDGYLGDGKKSVVLDADKVKFPLFLRTSKSGERIIPLGMHDHKKVLSILKDRKVPILLRTQFPVVSQAEGRVLWIVGVAISDEFKVTSKTRKVLVLIRKGGNFLKHA